MPEEPCVLSGRGNEVSGNVWAMQDNSHERPGKVETSFGWNAVTHAVEGG